MPTEKILRADFLDKESNNQILNLQAPYRGGTAGSTEPAVQESSSDTSSVIQSYIDIAPGQEYGIRMKQAKILIQLIGIPVFIAGCAPDNVLETLKTSAQPLVLTAGIRMSTEGILSYGAVVFAENPTTLMEAGDFHGYEIDGRAGGNITITMNGSSCGAPDTLLDLFGPEDAAGNRAFLIENDDANLGPCTLDARIANFVLPATGTYLIVATSYLQEGGNGHYKLQVTCNNNACVDPASPTFAASQISQAAINAGAFTPAQLFDIGDFTFEHIFTVPEGLGNALLAAPANNTPRPNFRRFPNNVHFAAYGAPEAQSCVSCHNVGGDDGAGDNNHNIFQIGDGINRASGVPRNPPPLLGSGLRQRIGEEMTAELQGQLAAGKAQAIATNSNVTVALSSKTRNFGSVIAKPDGTVDFTNINKGIDTDLVVKPFGWKGREATLRRFIEGSFRVHFGMQTTTQVTKQCPNVNLLGTGACPDPDGDGVVNEITEGLLSAEAVYMGLLETPVRVPAPTAAAQLRVTQGEVLFNQVNCQACHTQNMTINNPIHVEPGDLGGAGITLNLATDTKDPHPALNANGSMTVEIWSDFRRHDMGAEDCDSKPFNQIGACFFMTPPLWGIADSAPYLHDGRAATLLDAILLHGAGDSVNSVNAFKALSSDNQSAILEFLLSLGRQEDKDAGPVDLSGFRIEQTGSLLEKFLPAGTVVPHGGFVIVGRNATQAAFELNYGVTLGPTVKYVNGGNAFPIIDGGETFTLFDTNSVLIDGRSIAEPAGGLRTFSRVRCDLAPSLATSWSSVATSIAAASPGRGPLPTGQNRICISEVADSANTNFEYVEIFIEGHAGGGLIDGPSCSGSLFTTTPLDLATNDNCPYDVCGLNGVWMGGGVPFRTLRLDHGPNERGFRIASFHTRNETLLRPDVINDTLIGWGPSGTAGEIAYDLIGSTLELKRSVSDIQGVLIDESIKLKIENISYKPSLAECASPYQCATRLIPVYTFTATTGNGCPIEVCRPGLNPDDSLLPNLHGDAVIFQGDLYDENTYRVTITPTVNPSGTFNITCLGSAISKLHFLRQTSASQSPTTPANPPPSENQRQALLRLLTADYCGSGNRENKPDELQFTRNGIGIKLKFSGTQPASSYQPKNPENDPDNGFQVNGGSIEARWDSTGATCIGTPRLVELSPDTITTICNRDQHSLQPCASSTTPFDIESQNPKP